MRKMVKILLIFGFISMIGGVILLTLNDSVFLSAQVCGTYDDFSSGMLDNSKWEIRQDVEGQPFMEEYRIDNNLSNFHTQQNTIGDRRVYLVPKHTFTTGDILEYDFNVISKEGNYMQMDLLTGNQYIRVGIMGYISGVQGYDELGTSHIKIEFQENNFHLERTSPSNINLIDNLDLTNDNGNYTLYIGSVSGHNGKTHIDFDNFKICTNPCYKADFNHDNKVDWKDIAPFSSAYGSKDGSSKYNVQADFNNDDKIDYKDLSIFSGCYRSSW